MKSSASVRATACMLMQQSTFPKFDEAARIESSRFFFHNNSRRMSDYGLCDWKLRAEMELYPIAAWKNIDRQSDPE